VPHAGTRRPQRIEPVAPMVPLLLLLCTLARSTLLRAVFARDGRRPRVHAGSRRDACRRAMGHASRSDRIAARRPTVNRAAVPAAVSALGSFLH